MKKISPEILKLVKNRPDIIPAIMEVSGRSYPTVVLWVRENSELLTMHSCMEVLKEKLGLTTEELFNPAA